MMQLTLKMRGCNNRDDATRSAARLGGRILGLVLLSRQNKTIPSQLEDQGQLVEKFDSVDLNNR